MPHNYPYAKDDRLLGLRLDNDFELSSGTIPPNGTTGGAGRFKQWMDTSVSPPALRVATAVRATAGSYVASEWATLGILDTTNRQFNYQGGWHGSLYMDGDYIYMAGGIGTVFSTGGPFIYSDLNNTAFQLGSGNQGFIFIDHAGADRFHINSNGSFEINTVLFGNNNSGFNILYNGGGAGAVYLGASASFFRNTLQEFQSPDASTNYMSIGNNGVSVLSGDLTVTNNIVTGKALYLGFPELFFNGNSSFAGPMINFDNTNFEVHLGSGGGGFLFKNNANTNLGIINSAGNLILNGSYIYPDNGGGLINTTGGPLIYGDGNAIIIKPGVGDWGLIVQNYAGANMLSCDKTNTVTYNNFIANTTATVNGLLTLSGTGSALIIPNGDLRGGNDIAAAGTFRRIIGGGKGARVECWGGDWDSMSFSMTAGKLGLSPDLGATGYLFTPTSSFSDARLKDNIRDSEVDALEMLRQTPVRAFEWNDEGRRLMPWASPVECGLVAQELEDTISVAVGTAPFADEPMYINDQNLTPYLIRAIQQIADRLDAGGL